MASARITLTATYPTAQVWTASNYRMVPFPLASDNPSSKQVGNGHGVSASSQGPIRARSACLVLRAKSHNRNRSANQPSMSCQQTVVLNCIWVSGCWDSIVGSARLMLQRLNSETSGSIADSFSGFPRSAYAGNRATARITIIFVSLNYCYGYTLIRYGELILILGNANKGWLELVSV